MGWPSDTDHPLCYEVERDGRQQPAGLPMIYVFGGYELDLARYELRGHGSIVPIEP